MRKIDKYMLIATGIAALLSLIRSITLGNVQLDGVFLFGLLAASILNGCIFGGLAYVIFGRKSYKEE